MKSTFNDLDSTLLLRFLLWRNFCIFLPYYFLYLLFSSSTSFHSFFHLLQFLSNFFRYFSSNFPLFHPYNNFAIYFPGSSILLYSSVSFFFSILSCHLTSTPFSFLNSSINSSAFFKFSFLSYVSPSAINPFHHTKYFSTPFIFFLFIIFSTSHSSTSSTSTGFPSFFFCSFTCFLY